MHRQQGMNRYQHLAYSLKDTIPLIFVDNLESKTRNGCNDLFNYLAKAMNISRYLIRNFKKLTDSERQYADVIIRILRRYYPVAGSKDFKDMINPMSYTGR